LADSLISLSVLPPTAGDFGATCCPSIGAFAFAPNSAGLDALNGIARCEGLGAGLLLRLRVGGVGGFAALGAGGG
jgi:hypothetical protein